MQKLAILVNFFGLLLSGALLSALLVSMPSAIIKGSDTYRREAIQEIETEQDIATLRRKASSEISFLISSNVLCRALLFSSMAITMVNLAIFLVNVVQEKRTVRSRANSTAES